MDIGAKTNSVSRIQRSYSLNPLLANYRYAPHRRTPLMLAAANNSFDACKELIKKCEAKVNLKDQSKQTALHLAASNGFDDIVQILLANEANCNAVDKNNQTPLFLASKNGHRNTVDILLKSAAVVDIANAEKMTAMQVAKEGGHTDIYYKLRYVMNHGPESIHSVGGEDPWAQEGSVKEDEMNKTLKPSRGRTSAKALATSHFRDSRHRTLPQSRPDSVDLGDKIALTNPTPSIRVSLFHEKQNDSESACRTSTTPSIANNQYGKNRQLGDRRPLTRSDSDDSAYHSNLSSLRTTPMSSQSRPASSESAVSSTKSFDSAYFSSSSQGSLRSVQSTPTPIKEEELPPSEELNKCYDELFKNINSGKCAVPPSVFGIHVVQEKGNIYIYAQQRCEEAVTEFAVKTLTTKHFKVVGIRPPKYLNACHICNDTSCPSITGTLQDIGPKSWIGPGSEIIAIKSETWQQLCENENTNALPIPQNGHRINSWTIGCHLMDQNNKYLILTTAHPLNNIQTSTDVTFITQTSDKVHVLGTTSRGLFSESERVDVLYIALSNEVDNLLGTKMKYPCKEQYVVEPDFTHEPDLGDKVTKRGSRTGNTYGKIIAKDRFAMVVHPQTGFIATNAIDAFAVNSAETGSRVQQLFADSGDSGSLVFENKKVDHATRCVKAYGLVSCNMEICSELHGEDMEENAIVCVKILKCQEWMRDIHEVTAQVQTISTHVSGPMLG